MPAVPRESCAYGVWWSDWAQTSQQWIDEGGQTGGKGAPYDFAVLHVTPEAAEGGPLGLVRTGDVIELDVPGRRIELLVEDAVLEERRRGFTPPAHPGSDRGYKKLFLDTVLQADRGCDFDFLVPRPNGITPAGERR